MTAPQKKKQKKIMVCRALSFLFHAKWLTDVSFIPITNGHQSFIITQYNMPRSTNRQKVLQEEVLLRNILMILLVRHQRRNGGRFSRNPFLVPLVFQLWYVMQLHEKRYTYRNRYRSTKRASVTYTIDLATLPNSTDGYDSEPEWLNHDEFC